MSSAAQSCTGRERACPRAKESVCVRAHEKMAACHLLLLAAPPRSAKKKTAAMIIINNNGTLSVSGPCGCSSSSSCNSYSYRIANSAAACSIALPPAPALRPSCFLLHLPVPVALQPAPRYLRCRSCIHSYSFTCTVTPAPAFLAVPHLHWLAHSLISRFSASLIPGLRRAAASHTAGTNAGNALPNELCMCRVGGVLVERPTMRMSNMRDK